MSTEVGIPFRALGNYEWPATPVDHGLDRLREDLLKRFRKPDPTTGIDVERTQAAATDLLDRIVDAPSHHPLMAELDATLKDWLSDSGPEDPDTQPGPVLQTIVLPPCDREDFLSCWARERGLDILPTDKRAEDLDPLDDPSLSPLVIPRLEDRYLRTPEGLIAVRALIDRLAAMRRRTVVGCNSWAWQFLRKSCEIDLVLSDPMTFRAFNRQRLRAWLGTLAHGTSGGEAAEGRLCFRDVAKGQDVFGNGEGEAELSSTMTDLAKRSLGIPWVAWYLWRSALRTALPDASGAEFADGKAPGGEAPGGEASVEMQDAPPVDPDADRGAKALDTIWVGELRSFSLPSRSDQNALLVLHALLIHGGLTDANIRRTVPLITYTHVLSSLLRAGLVDRNEADGVYRCVPAAYPAIRDGLRNNGYPMDVL